ncbi:MAG: hypothetical protein RLZZ326_2704 [Planctomycetota bacterium]|jgi:hypothetical protein
MLQPIPEIRPDSTLESGLTARVTRAAVVALSRHCCFLAIAVAQVANASPETDREVKRVAQIHTIPDADAEFFAARIDAVEQSPNAVVVFETMSPWRQKRLLEFIEQWARTFPFPKERTQTITHGHSWSIMGQIAQLFVIPPRLTPPEEAAAIDSQMAELREILVEELFPKVRNSISTAVQSSDAESALLTAEDIDSLTATVIDSLLMSATLQKDDDLNPWPRWRIASSDFSETKRRIREAAAATVVKPPMPISENSVKSFLAARQAGDDSEAQRLSDSIVTDLLMGMGGDWRSTGPVVAVLDKAFRDARPASLETEYHTLSNILETMIDTAAIKAGNEERLAIEKANEERWAAERQRDFAEVVARLPQNQVPRAEQLSIAKGNSRGTIYLFVNVALVGLLAAIAWMRRRKRLAQESTP